jgi:hypothetical protein
MDAFLFSFFGNLSFQERGDISIKKEVGSLSRHRGSPQPGGGYSPKIDFFRAPAAQRPSHLRREDLNAQRRVSQPLPSLLPILRGLKEVPPDPFWNDSCLSQRRIKGFGNSFLT